MEVGTLKFPVVIADDAQKMILDELFSDDTEKYLENTTFTTPGERWAFRSGMNYAGLLFATKCYKFSNATVPMLEIEDYCDKYCK